MKLIDLTTRDEYRELMEKRIEDLRSRPLPVRILRLILAEPDRVVVWGAIIAVVAVLAWESTL